MYSSCNQDVLSIVSTLGAFIIIAILLSPLPTSPIPTWYDHPPPVPYGRSCCHLCGTLIILMISVVMESCFCL